MTATTILTTKLNIPPLPRGGRLVRRPRLVERLNAGLERKLTLISAPPGFGKTTLLSEWIHQGDKASLRRPAAVAWLSLDERDNDPARWLAYVIAALQTVDAEVGQDALAAMQAPQPPPADRVLGGLTNDIAALSLDLVLVLDDYHLVTMPAIHQALDLLLEHIPDNLHLVIATRADPPLRLARLRGRGQLNELRQSDLRFTADEIDELLSRVMGLDIPAGDIHTLEARTEGWVAGIQMAAMSLQGRDAARVSHLIQDLSGSHRFILDYLVQEVLQQQPEGLQAFLLRTCILERLTGPLCDALYDESCPGESQATLERMDRENLFLVALDDERRWYRYHRLFADLLRARLGQTAPEQVPVLNRRASLWHEEEGTIEEAVAYAVAAQDVGRVAELVERHGRSFLLSGELVTLNKWFACLPEPAVQASAPLAVLHAWTLLLTGQLAAVEPRLQQAEQALSLRPVAGPAGDISAIRAYLAAQQNDLPRCIEMAHLALEHLGPGQLAERGVAYFVLSAAYLLQGEVASASQAMIDASEIGQRGGNLHVAVPALNSLASLQAQQGRLSQAHATAQEARRLATGPSGRLLPMASSAVSTLAELACQWNQLDDALVDARQSIELGLRWGNADSLASNYLTLAQVLQARGDLAGAEHALGEAERMGREYTLTPLFWTQYEASRAALWLAQGNLAAAERWAQENRVEQPGPIYHAQALAWARVQLALGRPAEALRMLGAVTEAAQPRGLVAVLVAVQAMQALAYAQQGADEDALAALGEALALADPEGFVRTFLDLGEPMAKSLGAFRRRRPDACTGLVARLLAAFGTETRAPRPDKGPASLVEALSERELEVLRLVAAGRSNHQIAAELVIALGTVKAHTSNIYAKLGVRSRTQAAARARELGLI